MALNESDDDDVLIVNPKVGVCEAPPMLHRSLQPSAAGCCLRSRPTAVGKKRQVIDSPEARQPSPGPSSQPAKRRKTGPATVQPLPSHTEPAQQATEEDGQPDPSQQQGTQSATQPSQAASQAAPARGKGDAASAPGTVDIMLPDKLVQNRYLAELGGMDLTGDAGQ